MPNPTFIWGQYDSESIIQSMDESYSEVVHWRKNTFLALYGNAGKSFVSELSRLYKAYADGSALEAVALKACTVMSILLLQRPFRSSKQKDHSACLARRMLIWKNGDIRNLLEEGCALQSRLPKFGASSSDNLATWPVPSPNSCFRAKPEPPCNYSRSKEWVVFLVLTT